MQPEFENHITLNPGKYVEGKFLLEDGLYLFIRYNFIGFITVKTASERGEFRYIQASSSSHVRFEYMNTDSKLNVRTTDGLWDEYEISKTDSAALSFFLSNLFEFQLGWECSLVFNKSPTE